MALYHTYDITPEELGLAHIRYQRSNRRRCSRERSDHPRYLSAVRLALTVISYWPMQEHVSMSVAAESLQEGVKIAGRSLIRAKQHAKLEQIDSNDRRVSHVS